MKDGADDIKVSCYIGGKSRIRNMWDRQVHKMKNGNFSCPLCKETFIGLAAFGAHLKDHCT